MTDRLAELLTAGILQRPFTRAEIDAQRAAKVRTAPGTDARDMCEARLAEMEYRAPGYDRSR
jgi:hypothetical protein